MGRVGFLPRARPSACADGSSRVRIDGEYGGRRGGDILSRHGRTNHSYAMGAVTLYIVSMLALFALRRHEPELCDHIVRLCILHCHYWR